MNGFGIGARIEIFVQTWVIYGNLIVSAIVTDIIHGHVQDDLRINLCSVFRVGKKNIVFLGI